MALLLLRQLFGQRNCVFVGERLLGAVFLALVDALEEVRRFVQVFEEKPRETVLELKRMEKSAVLIVFEADVKLLIPQHAAMSLDVDQLQEERVAHNVVH